MYSHQAAYGKEIDNHIHNLNLSNACCCDGRSSGRAGANLEILRPTNKLNEDTKMAGLELWKKLQKQRKLTFDTSPVLKTLCVVVLLYLQILKTFAPKK